MFHNSFTYFFVNIYYYRSRVIPSFILSLLKHTFQIKVLTIMRLHFLIFIMSKHKIFRCTDQIIFWTVVNILAFQVQYSFGMIIQGLNLNDTKNYQKSTGSLGATIMTSYD